MDKSPLISFVNLWAHGILLMILDSLCRVKWETTTSMLFIFNDKWEEHGHLPFCNSHILSPLLFGSLAIPIMSKYGSSSKKKKYHSLYIAKVYIKRWHSTYVVHIFLTYKTQVISQEGNTISITQVISTPFITIKVEGY